MKKQIFSIALALSALASPVQAQTTSAVPVSYADLALSTPAGIKALDARLEQAARSACGFDKSERSLALNVHQKHCLAAKHGEIAASRRDAIAAAQTPRTLAAR